MLSRLTKQSRKGRVTVVMDKTGGASEDSYLSKCLICCPPLVLCRFRDKQGFLIMIVICLRDVDLGVLCPFFQTLCLGIGSGLFSLM